MIRTSGVSYLGIPLDGPACDPVPLDDLTMTGKESSIGDPEWGMYVTPDDPLRDTPEKARAYYTRLFEQFPRLVGRLDTLEATKATDSDLKAAAALLHA